MRAVQFCFILDALNYIERMQNTLSALQTEEKQLSDDLAVFGMEYVYSIETANLQEVRNITVTRETDVSKLQLIRVGSTFQPVRFPPFIYSRRKRSRRCFLFSRKYLCYTRSGNWSTRGTAFGVRVKRRTFGPYECPT